MRDKCGQTSRAATRDVTKAVMETLPCFPSSAGFWFQGFLPSATRTLDAGGDSDSWEGPGTKSRPGFEWRGPRRRAVAPASRVPGGGQGRGAAGSGGAGVGWGGGSGGDSNSAAEVRVLRHWRQGP